MIDRTVYQPSLFGDDNGIDVSAVMERLSHNASLFYTRSEVASITGRTFSEVRQAIDKMQLDAYYFAGTYRISADAIRDWAENWKRYEDITESFNAIVRRREVPQAYCVCQMYKAGEISEDQARKFIGPYVGKQLLKQILKRDFNVFDNTADVTERKPEDWYFTDKLPLPEEGNLDTWANVLRIPSKDLKKEGGFSAKRPVKRKRIVEFLIKTEVVNLTAFDIKPFRQAEESELNIPESVQPTLF